MDITKLAKSAGHKDYSQIDKLPVIFDANLADKLKNADSIAQIMPLICSNPSFYAHIVLLANAKAKNKASDFECAENAASYLGFAHLQQLYERLPKVSLDELPESLQQVLEQGRLSHEFVGHLVKSANSATKSLQGLALLFHLPLWLLASNNPKLLSDFYYWRHYNPFAARYYLLDGQRDAKVSLENLSSLTQNFPQRLLDAYADLHLENTRSLTRKLCIDESGLSDKSRIWLHRDCAKISLVHLIIESIFQPFYPRKIARLTKAICLAFDVTEQQVQSSLQLTLKTSKRAEQFYLYLPSPAPFSKAKSEPVKKQLASSTNKPQGKQAKVTSSHDKTIERPRYDREAVMATIRRMQQKPLSLKDPNQALKQALLYLSKTFSFDRIVFASLSPDRMHCRGKLSTGCANNIALQKFNFSIRDFPIFNKFVENGSFLVFDRGRHEVHWSKLPEFIHSDSSIRRFIMHSISFTSSKPNLLVYIDNSSKQFPFEPELVKDYREYMHQLVKVIRILQPPAKAKPVVRSSR